MNRLNLASSLQLLDEGVILVLQIAHLCVVGL